MLRKSLLLLTASCSVAAAGSMPGAENVSKSATIYVNNLTGDDGWDGLVPEPAGDGKSGPAKSITGALKKASPSSRIIIANTGQDYRERVCVNGRCRGTASQPFIIEGNGATVSGLVHAPAEKWTLLKDDIYWFENTKEDGKPGPMPNSNWLGHYQHQGWFAEKQAPEIFFVDGKPAPHVQTLEAIQPGGFFYETQGKRRLHFRLPEGKKLADLKIELPLNEGVFIDSDYVVLRNLRSIYSQDDGFAGFWGIGVVLENIEGSYNCDQGISFHGFSTTVIDGGLFERNGGCGIADVMRSITVYRNCIIRDNLVTGALLQGHAHKFLNCVFYGNADVGKRGPSQVQAGSGARAEFEHCLFKGSGDTEAGTALSLENGRMIHCTVSGFKDGATASSSLEIISSILQNCGGRLTSAGKGGKLSISYSILGLGEISVGDETVRAEGWQAFTEKNKAFASDIVDSPALEGDLLQLPENSRHFKAGQYNQTPGARLKTIPGYNPKMEAPAGVEHP